MMFILYFRLEGFDARLQARLTAYNRGDLTSSLAPRRNPWTGLTDGGLPAAVSKAQG